jgi:hypothetical protein
MILEVLQAAIERERGDRESIETYLDEDLLYLKVGRRYPQTREMLRGNLYYLLDKEYVKQKRVRVGKTESLMWRITAAGTDLLEGNIRDAGVHIE